jgi:hypothetical protein
VIDHRPCSTWNREPRRAESNITGVAAAKDAKGGAGRACGFPNESTSARADTCALELNRYRSGKLWKLYLQLSEVQSAFKGLKAGGAIQSIHHQSAKRQYAHILVAFMMYCLHVTLKQLPRQYAPGLILRAVLRSSPPCSSPTCISRLPMGASGSSPATRSSIPIHNSHSPNSAGV